MAEVDDEVSPLLQRLDADARTLLFRTREPRVRRPTFAAAESRRASLSGSGSQPTHPLIGMRVLTRTRR